MIRWLFYLGCGGFSFVLPAIGWSQTDYYNTDAGRPVTIEDAHPVERYAFEAQVAPLRLERRDQGGYHWEFEPEMAYGVYPGTHLEAGVHLDVTDRDGERGRLRLDGIEIALFHNLNLETRTLPAFAVAAEALIPTGDAAGDRLYPSMKAIATRTFSFARFHLNGEYTWGSGSTETAGEISRWMAGIAIDRVFPLSGALFIADVFVEQPVDADAELEWTAEAGARYQLDPFFALDLGIGRRLTGSDQAWFVTLGAARAFGIQSLIPGLGRS